MADRILHLQTEAAQRLKEKLIATYGEDADLIRDMVQGETSLHEAIAAAAEQLAIAEGEQEGIENTMGRLKLRHDRAKARVEGIRDAIQAAMETAELKSLKTPAATLSMRPSPARLEITDPKAIPSVFMVQPAPVPDKNAIKDALKAGEVVAGCTLSNQPHALSVRMT